MIDVTLLKDHLHLPDQELSTKLDEMRARQQAYIDKHQGRPIKPNDFTLEYIEKVAAIKTQKEVETKDVTGIFKQAIQRHEKAIGRVWAIRSNLPQYIQIVRHLTDLINKKTEKGLLLSGISGAGKTTIMRDFYLPTYRFFTQCNYIPIIKAETLPDRKDEMIGNTHIHCVIDDLGIELNNISPDKSGWLPSKQDIANKVATILDRRRNGKITHVTTNHELENLAIIYGERTQWRFEEQFEFVKF